MQGQVLHWPNYNTGIILEQSYVWNFPLQVTDTQQSGLAVPLGTAKTQWCPEKTTSIIRTFYGRMTSKVVCGCPLTDAFQVWTGMRQGTSCHTSYFQQATDKLLKTPTAQRRNRFQWVPWTQRDDLGFVDDLALLSNTQQQKQEQGCG